MIKRALNQKTCRRLSFEQFLDLASSLNCVGVEPRNDLGRPFFDGLDPRAAATMARARGLKFMGLSEVYGFNVWSDERAQQIESLIAIAEVSGAQTISLIPCVDERPVMPLRDVMREILPMLEGTSVQPLIEPIGFASSSLRGKVELAEAIAAVGRFGMVHDTFQHCIAGETEIFPQHTAVVHISGISDQTVALDAAQDAHRILIDADDRCGNLGQIRRFLEAGFVGAFSFECTEKALLERVTGAQIKCSFEYIEAQV